MSYPPRLPKPVDPVVWHTQLTDQVDDIDYWAPPKNHWDIPEDELLAMRDFALSEGYKMFPYHYYLDLREFVLYRIDGRSLSIADFSGLGPEAVAYIFNSEDPSKASLEMAELYKDLISYSSNPDMYEEAIRKKDEEDEKALLQEALHDLPELERQLLYERQLQIDNNRLRALAILEKNQRDRIEFLSAEKFIRENIHLFR